MRQQIIVKKILIRERITMKKNIFYLIVFVSLSTLIISGCGNGEDEAENQETEQVDADADNEVQLPDQITATVYDTGSAGHSQLTAISDAISRAYGTQIRMI